MAESIEKNYLIKTVWDQEAPYNNDCPHYAVQGAAVSKNSVTGSTNTAASQIIYYWITQKGKDFHFEVTANDYYYINNYTTWDLDNYVLTEVSPEDTKYNVKTIAEINEALASGKYTSAEYIAALNLYCGIKNHVNYGDSTGTRNVSYSSYTGTDAEVYKALGFDSYNYITTDNDEIFDQKNGGLTKLGYSLVQECLDYGEVIQAGIPGHTVIIDGYYCDEQKNDWYHLNMGSGDDEAETTKWYSQAELESDPTLTISSVLLDTTPELSVIVKNTKDEYCAGSIIRGLERINHSQTTDNVNVTFGLDTGSSITQESSWEITSDAEVTFDFGSAKIDLVYTDANGIVTQNDFTIRNLIGNIVLSSSKANAAVYEKGDGDLNITVSGGIYAGKKDISAETVCKDLDEFKKFGLERVESLIKYATGYAFYSGSGDDTITLNANSVILGDMNLGDGDNKITISSEALWAGDLYNEADIEFKLTGITDTAMIRARTDASLFAANANLSATLEADQVGLYLLIDGSAAKNWTAMNGMSLMLTYTEGGEQKKEELTVNGKTVTTADDIKYSLSITDDGILYLSAGKNLTVTNETKTVSEGYTFAKILLNSGTLIMKNDDDTAYFETLEMRGISKINTDDGELIGSELIVTNGNNTIEGSNIIAFNSLTVEEESSLTVSETQFKEIIKQGVATDVRGAMIVLGTISYDDLKNLISRSDMNDLTFNAVDEEVGNLTFAENQKMDLTFTQKGITGTKNSDKITVKKNAKITLDTSLDMGEGSNTVYLYANADFTLNGKLSNVSTITISNGTNSKVNSVSFQEFTQADFAQINASGDRNFTFSIGKFAKVSTKAILGSNKSNKLTVGANSELNVAGDVQNITSLNVSAGTAYKANSRDQKQQGITKITITGQLYSTNTANTFSFGNYTKAVLGAISTGANNDKITIGKYSEFTAGNVNLGSGKDTFTLNSYSTAELDSLTNAYKLTVSNGSKTAFTTLRINGIVSGTGNADKIAIGNYDHVYIAGSIDMGEGNDKVTIGKYSEFKGGDLKLGKDGDESNTVSIGSYSCAFFNSVENANKFTVSDKCEEININGILTGSKKKDTFSFGNKNCIRVSDKISLYEGDDAFKIGSETNFTSKEIDLGAGKNTVSIGGKSQVETGAVSGVYKLTVSSGNKDTSTDFTALGKYSGTENNDVLSIGSYTNVKIEGSLSFVGGSDQIKFGDNSTFNVGGLLDFGNCSVKISGGKNSTLVLKCTDSTPITSLKLGSKSEAYLSSELYTRFGTQEENYYDIGAAEEVAVNFRDYDYETGDDNKDNVRTLNDTGYNGWLGSFDTVDCISTENWKSVTWSCPDNNLVLQQWDKDGNSTAAASGTGSVVFDEKTAFFSIGYTESAIGHVATVYTLTLA